MARLTREESQALTRAKLLANAVRVVAAEGYEGASIDKIAEAAGYSKGAFYSNFASKEELFLELLETHAGQDVVEIARLLDGVSVPAAIIDRFCEWADSRASDPTWGLLALELMRRARRAARRSPTSRARSWCARCAVTNGRLMRCPMSIRGTVGPRSRTRSATSWLTETP